MKLLNLRARCLKNLPMAILAMAITIAAPAKAQEGGGKTQLQDNKSHIAKVLRSPDYKLRIGLYDKIKPSTKEAAQGMAIYKNTMFALYNTGVCDVLSIGKDGLKKLSSYNLGSHAKTNHANSASFGREFAPGNKQFPLLYVSRCYKGYRTCVVEDVSLSGSKLVQTISVGTFRGDVSPESDIQWMVGDDGFLYMFGNTKRDWNIEGNKFVVAKLRLPKLSEGQNVKIDLNDALEFYYLEDYGCTPATVLQGCCIRDGIMFLPVGFGSFNTPGKMYVWDLKGRKELKYIDLTHLTVGEPEDCDFYKGHLMLRMAGSHKVYQIDF